MSRGVRRRAAAALAADRNGLMSRQHVFITVGWRWADGGAAYCHKFALRGQSPGRACPRKWESLGRANDSTQFDTVLQVLTVLYQAVPDYPSFMAASRSMADAVDSQLWAPLPWPHLVLPLACTRVPDKPLSTYCFLLKSLHHGSLTVCWMDPLAGLDSTPCAGRV